MARARSRKEVRNKIAYAARHDKAKSKHESLTPSPEEVSFGAVDGVSSPSCHSLLEYSPRMPR